MSAVSKPNRARTASTSNRLCHSTRVMRSCGNCSNISSACTIGSVRGVVSATLYGRWRGSWLAKRPNTAWIWGAKVSISGTMTMMSEGLSLLASSNSASSSNQANMRSCRTSTSRWAECVWTIAMLWSCGETSTGSRGIGSRFSSADCRCSNWLGAR